MKGLYLLITLVGIFFVGKFIIQKTSVTNIDRPESKVSTNSPTFNIKRKYTYVALQIKANQTWNQFRDFSLSASDLIEQTPDKKALAQYSRQVIQEISSCLKKDLCGQTPEETSAYFDPNHTEAHDLIERSLSILVSMKEEGLEDYDIITQEELLGLLDLKNESIQTLGLELAVVKGLSEKDFEKAIHQLKNFHEDAIGPAYGMLQETSRQSTYQRDLYLQSLKETFKSDDALKVVNLAKNLNLLELEKEDLTDIAKASCHHKSVEQNFKALDHYISSKADSIGMNISLQSFCQK